MTKFIDHQHKQWLSLAAWAAGHTIRFMFDCNGAGEAIGYQEYEICETRWEESPTAYGWDNWNPLEDDGDALRLAVHLGFINPGQWPCVGFIAEQMLRETGTVDWYAATRIAIVKAAAEIGEKL